MKQHEVNIKKTEDLKQLKREKEGLELDIDIIKQLKVNLIYLRDAVQKNTSYSVTLSLKVGGGQDEITLVGAAKIVTRW